MQAVIVCRFVAGAILASPDLQRMRWQVTMAAFAWLGAGLAIYIFNGLTDLVEDRVNGSMRPIASGRLTVRNALWLVCGSAVLALVLGVISGIAVQTSIFLVLGYVYSDSLWPAKRHWAAASLIIMASGVVTFWAGSQAAGVISRAGIIAGAALIAWMGLVGALVKDVSDVAGDMVSGRKTYAVVFGPRHTRRFAAILGLATGLSASAASAVLAPFLLPAMMILLIGAAAITLHSIRVDSSSKPPDARKLYRLFMVTQYFATLMTIVSGIWYALDALYRLLVVGHGTRGRGAKEGK